MKNIILLLFIIGAFLQPIVIQKVSSETENSKETIRIFSQIYKAEKHSVVILSFGDEGGQCSGVVLKTTEKESYVLTAKHCIRIIDEMYVEGIPVKTITTSVSQDLALIITQKPIPIKIGSEIAKNNAKVGSELYGVGYPNLNLFIIHGKVFLKGIHDHYAKMIVISGCSGGGLYNDNGELVGIVWGNYNLGLTIYEPISQIRKFLKEVKYEEVK